jgi:hypothetical protein
MNSSFLYKIVLAGTLMLLIISCKKFVEVPPPTYQLGGDEVFKSDATATSAVVGIYSEMMAGKYFSSSSTTLYTGMYADELTYYIPSDRDEFIASKLSEASHGILTSNFWAPAYRFIYTANLCIEKLNASKTISQNTKTILIGECKFIRAFCFFNLVNLFGDVPLTLTSDYRSNAKMPRTPSVQVYDQIISDLKEAESQLSNSYPTSEKIRPNKWTAGALLARVYLYNSRWADAEREASAVINSGGYSLVLNLNNVFLKNSSEAIWQLQVVNTSNNTWEGNEILPATTSSQPTYIVRSGLLDSFETNDQRKQTWVASRSYSGQAIYYPYKYKVYGNNVPVTEYYMVFRLAEMYLIRAEAKANLGDINGAKADLNIIRSRAGLANAIANDQSSLLNVIEKERRIELAFEWGHRWFDLKRWGRASNILDSLKPATWQNEHIVWPIPIDQIRANSSLKQNPGY